MATFITHVFSFLLFSLFLAGAASASVFGKAEPKSGQLWISSGFLSYHPNREPNYNERNTGVGVEYYFNNRHALVAGHYKNSVHGQTTYAHYVYMPLAIGMTRIGAGFGVVNGYPELNNGKFGPAIMPIASTTFSFYGHPVGINIVWIPSIDDRVDASIALQVKAALN